MVVRKFIRRTIADFAGRMVRSCFDASCKAIATAYVHEKSGNQRVADIFWQRADKQKTAYSWWLAVQEKYEVKEGNHDRPEK